MQTVSHGTSSYQEKADGAILATGQKKSFFNKSLMNSNYISQFVDRWAGWQKALNVQIEPRRKIKGYACWVRGTMTGEWGDILFPWMLSSCCLILCAKCFFFFFTDPTTDNKFTIWQSIHPRYLTLSLWKSLIILEGQTTVSVLLVKCSTGLWQMAGSLPIHFV